MPGHHAEEEQEQHPVVHQAHEASSITKSCLQPRLCSDSNRTTTAIIVGSEG